MREIKFRIWDKQLKKFVKNDASLHCFSNWSVDAFSGTIIDYVGVMDGDHKTVYTQDCNPKYYAKGTKIIKEPRYVLQQYTGINIEGKRKGEIYEGDIILQDGRIMVIEYSEEFGAFVGEVYKFDGEEVEQSYHYYADIYSNGKIVGNIFENRELLL